MFYIEDDFLKKQNDYDLIINQEKNKVYLSDKENEYKELIGSFESEDMASYIAYEIESHTSAKRLKYTTPKEIKNKYLFKFRGYHKLNYNEYVLMFNNEPTNHLFFNFKTLKDVYDYIEKITLVKLYNDWLDYIGSDTIADKVDVFYIGKIIKEEKHFYVMDVKEYHLNNEV